MSTIKNDFHCPNCHTKARVKTYTIVGPKELERILDRTLFIFECKTCHEKIMLDYPIIYQTDSFIVYYDPHHEQPKIKMDILSRLCLSYDDFKEKIMLFTDGYNDIIIEFIKQFFYRQLNSSEQRKVSLIRYDGEDHNNLVFYCQGLNKAFPCPKVFYQSILSQAKLKKIKWVTTIDKDNYRKYFKLR